MRRLVHAGAIAAMLSACPVRADPPRDDGEPSAAEDRDAIAFALYEKATRELEDGDYALAAKHFARADALSPTPAALEAALIAVLKTDDAVLGMTLVSRAGREPFNDRVGELADRARTRFADRVGRVVVTCEDCEASIDGVALEPGVASWQTLGEHLVTIRAAGGVDERRITVSRGDITTVQPSRRVAPVAAPPEAVATDVTTSSSGISPAFFWVGLGLTAAAGVGTIVSFADLSGIHDDFQQTPSAALADEGDAAQLRTRVLLGVTGGLAVATTLVGTLAVDWGGDDAEAVSVVTDGRTVGLRLRW